MRRSYIEQFGAKKATASWVAELPLSINYQDSVWNITKTQIVIRTRRVLISRLKAPKKPIYLFNLTSGRWGNFLSIFSFDRSLNELINLSNRALSSGRGFLLDKMKLNGTLDTLAMGHLRHSFKRCFAVRAKATFLLNLPNSASTTMTY